MARNLLGRYVWLIDTIRRYGSISLKRLSELWERSPFSNGEPLARRTLYNYRTAIDELFGIEIVCSRSTFEYSIASTSLHQEGMTDWLLNSAAMSNVLTSASDVADRIFIEDVPSARRYLGLVVDALRDSFPIRFSYHPYTKSTPTPDVVIEPYFLKIFRQRWYITGRNTRDGRIKTYALDRMADVTAIPEPFVSDPTFDAESYVRDAFGIIFSQGETKEVVLRADPRQAKYLRALPLHHSQHEVIHDEYSLFYYTLRITSDLLQEILSMGSRVEVIAPPELKAMLVDELSKTLGLYEK
ncbi:MAG: WYL domain-containing protein [Duncaniella sp.]|nr:WYL domain-containing protein [Duncaniella sp.]